jgi:tRNA (guanine37-N1)-methyltransferase
MDIYVLTLFPEMFTGMLSTSMLKRAQESGAIRIHLVNFRDYADDKHKTVDDAPFGGGAGMLLKPAPLFSAIDDLRSQWQPTERERIALMTPQGRPFTQRIAEELVQDERLVLVCGHYEGFDERVRTHLATDEISLGDFVLTGGEIAALAIIDAVSRLLPGVLGNEESAQGDSFSAGLLEFPQYTRPASYRGMDVPPVVLSGHHGAIEAWRHEQSLYRTWLRRPELLVGMTLSDADRQLIAGFEQGRRPQDA